MAGAQGDDSEFSFTAAVRGFTSITECGYHILDSVLVWKGNMETLKIVLRSLLENTRTFKEHTDTRSDEDVDDRPIVGHLPRELIRSSYT